MAKHQKTVAELESESGKPDSIRNLNGKNARKEKQIRNIVAEFKERLEDLTLPDDMPLDICVRYKDKPTKWISGEDIKPAAALLNFAGLL